MSERIASIVRRTGAALSLAALVATSALAQDGAELSSRLASGDERVRQDAVIGLAALDTHEAWELVLGALADPEPRVADQAQLQLGKMSDARFVALLLGEGGLGSRRDDVVLRAAEALGRVEVELDPEPLLRA